MKISGHVVSTKPISLSRAAKLISRFAAVDNGSSPAVSMYLQRAADAFNQLVHFHEKRSKIKEIENNPDKKTDRLEKSLDKDFERKSDKKRVKREDEKKPFVDEAKDLENPVKEKKKKRTVDEKKPNGDETKDLENPVKEKKKKRTVDEKKPNGDETKDLENSVKENKKRRKKKNDEADSKERSSSKKKRIEAVDS